MHLRRNIESVSYRTRRENVSFPRRGNKGPAIFKIKFERPDFSHSLRPASVLNAISQWKYRFCNENTNFKFQKLVLRTSFPIWDRLYQFQKYNEAVKYRVKFLFHVFLKFEISCNCSTCYNNSTSSSPSNRKTIIDIRETIDESL